MKYPNNESVLASIGASPAISAGGYHSVAVDPSGSVVAWGRNDFGQLGNGSTTNSPWAVETLFP